MDDSTSEGAEGEFDNLGLKAVDFRKEVGKTHEAAMRKKHEGC